MFFSGAIPFVIAGPCSAETKEQVMQTAAALSNGKVSLFRSGVWKPRTRPGSFEGNGIVALDWLQEMTALYQLPYTVEVAEPEHVELARQFGAAAVWIGARTTVNPFQVQKLADAVAQSGLPVLVKNPVNADIDLWLGAIERFEKAGAKDVAAIHRGFSHTQLAGGLRNAPLWQIPIELKRRRPELFLICDPSHISGNRNRVGEIAQKAMDLRFDGLMIEAHPAPDLAWSDAAQQVTPEALFSLLHNLVVREEHNNDSTGKVQLDYLRQHIDSLDLELVDLLARRLELAGQIGEIKRAFNMTAYQPTRWRQIVTATQERALLQGISTEFIHEVYERIHEESIRMQLQVLAGMSKEIKT